MSPQTGDSNFHSPLLPGFGPPPDLEPAVPRAISPHEKLDVIAEPLISATPPPELPARMLNEFVYCQRLFYFEHVEGIFQHSADTLRGAAIHKKVDSGNGKMPAAKRAAKAKANAADPAPTSEGQEAPEVPETIHSRSVTLGSDRLGVVAKLDLVESRVPQEDSPDQTVETCPVDYKAGAPRQEEEGNSLWPTDRMQLGVQMLVLRDNGYHCEQGIIYYRATKQRVPLEYSVELENWIIDTIAEARRVALSPMRPPPLIDSPKCVRCSLAPVCLPDEVTQLRAEPDEAKPEEGKPIRRLMTARDDARALYLNTPGLHVGIRDRVLQVKEKTNTIEEIRLSDLHHVALFGNIQLSTQAIHQLCRLEIPITYFSGGGWFYGQTTGHVLPNIHLRRTQFRLADDPLVCLRLARAMVQGKIRNQRTLLMRNHLEVPATVIAKLKNAIETAGKADRMESLLGVEGAAAAWYFAEFNGMLKVAPDLADDSAGPLAGMEEGPELRLDFTTRNRRPPRDPVNALLSLAYSVLAKDCHIALRTVGLDPGLGFYHQPRPGRPALALDLMEEFRPLIADSAVLAAVNNRMVTPKDFVRAGQAINLTPEGRKHFFQAYELRMNHLITHPVFDYKVSYRRALELQARLLARTLEGEIPDYLPLCTR